MDLDARQQGCRLQQSAPEADLVDRLVEEDSTKFNEAPLGEIAPAVAITLARPIGRLQQ
nr:hypothetical protein [uncultured Rhodopila sp.]